MAEVAQGIPKHTGALVAATQFRSTPIITSQETLRANGHFHRYVELLGNGREEILHCLAGTWLPMATARAHYDACDALGLSPSEQFAMGRAAAEHARTGWLSTFMSLARGAGATPWVWVERADRIWPRLMNGGYATAFRLGPKEARLEYGGCELFDVPYFRNGFRGMIDMLGCLLSKKHYTRELPRRTKGEVIFRVQWV